MNIIKLSIFTCLFVCAAAAAKSQSVPSGAEVFEMVKLAEAYRNSSDLSFTVLIKYADSAYTDSIAEQTTANYKLHSGLFYTYIDSTEIVQGYKYSVKVDHIDSVISVSNRQEYPDVLNMPVTDTLYWKTFVQTMTVTDVNDSTRTLKIKFKAGAMYTSYEVRYSTETYRMEQVKCYISASAPGVDGSYFPSGKALISFTFSNYSTTPISGTWFNEDKYITAQSGQFQPQPAYAGYHIESNIAQ